MPRSPERSSAPKQSARSRCATGACFLERVTQDAKLGRIPSRGCEVMPMRGSMEASSREPVRLAPQAGRGGMCPSTRSVIMTLFWRCSCWPFSFRRLLRGGRWQPSVNRFGRRFGRSEGSGNADSQRNNRNRREGGAKRRSRHDFGCVPAHPPSWAPSYLPLRADWARAPGRSGVFEDKRTLQRPSQSARTTQKEF